jgi:DHA1 family inner membrane transport protein
MHRVAFGFVLALGGFGIGVSEFLVMGLLPQIATDLLPDLYSSSKESAVAAAGSLSSAYALGVVAGMIVTPLVIRRLSERNALLLCSLSMFVWTVLTALSPSLSVAIALRFLAALTHASYIGVGAMAVAHVFGGKNYGRGSAVVHGGLTSANLVGVPILTALGAVTSWRMMLGASSLFFAAPCIVLLLLGRKLQSIESEGAQHKNLAGTGLSLAGNGRRANRTQLVFAAVAAVLFAAGGFTVVTYVAPVMVWAQHRPALLSTAAAMLLFGVGMNIGNFVAGWLADRNALLAFFASAVSGVLGTTLLLTTTNSFSAGTAMALLGILLGGCSPAAQVLFIRHLPGAPRLASSMPSGTANLGSFTGSLFGAGLLAFSGPQTVVAGACAVLALTALVFGVQQLLYAKHARTA